MLNVVLRRKKVTFHRAGCLYIYEVSNSLLPCYSLTLVGANLTTKDSLATNDSLSSLTILSSRTGSLSSLTLSMKSMQTVKWLQQVCTKATHFKDHLTSSLTSAPQSDLTLGVSRDRLTLAGELSQSWARNFDQLLHLAVDKKNRNIQMVS